MAELMGNDVLAQMLDGPALALRPDHPDVPERQRSRALHEEHAAIVLALRSRDEARALHLMDEHLRTRRGVLTLVPQAPTPQSKP
jgi:DNA-binding GntR family transcriptional regulator